MRESGNLPVIHTTLTTLTSGLITQVITMKLRASMSLSKLGSWQLSMPREQN